MKQFQVLLLAFATCAFIAFFCVECVFCDGSFVISEGRIIIGETVYPGLSGKEYVAKLCLPSLRKTLPLHTSGMGWGSVSCLVVFPVFLAGWYILLLLVSLLAYGERRSVRQILMLSPRLENRV